MTRFTRGICFEVAQDVLGALIAHWSAQAAEVRDAANPDDSSEAVRQALAAALDGDEG